jgi:hypothetical protein|tara:strand:+ start:174 stop:416 length:243 start_codon:yes stop_codon:yes gene_type:complete
LVLFFVKEEKLAFLRGKRKQFSSLSSVLKKQITRKTQRYNEAERIPESNPLHVFIVGGGKRRKRRRPFSREDDNDSDGFE